MLRRISGYTLLVGLAVILTYQFVVVLKGSEAAERSACNALTPERVDSAAQKIELQQLGGGKFRLADKKGKTVLLHFWFTQCKPCLEELPTLLRLKKVMAGKPFELVTISVDEDHDVLRQFVARHGLQDLTVLLDKERKTPPIFGTTKFPDSYLIDGSGTIRFRFVNQRNWASSVAQACVQAYLP